MYTVEITLKTGDKDEDESYCLTCPDEAGLFEMEKEVLQAALRLNAAAHAAHQSGITASASRKRYPEVALTATITEDDEAVQELTLTEHDCTVEDLARLKTALKQYIDGPCRKFYQGDARVKEEAKSKPFPKVDPGKRKKDTD